MEVLVFAYGSNLCQQRIADRVASARALTIAFLPGHVLRFHKRGRDGSGKADAYRTGEARDAVLGVVYRIEESDKRILDQYEGVGAGYNTLETDVSTPLGASQRAWIYQADPGWIDAGLKPYTWYRDYVVAGACQHGLEAAYVASIAAVDAIEDPDRGRDASARAVLSRAVDTSSWR